MQNYIEYGIIFGDLLMRTTCSLKIYAQLKSRKKVALCGAIFYYY